MDLSNKKIALLGSSTGIGFECALQASLLGAEVLLVARNQHNLQDARHKITKLSKCRPDILQIDLCDPGSEEVFKQYINSSWGGELDCLLLNSGGPSFSAQDLDVRAATWQNSFQSLFLSQILIAKFAINLMKANNFGRIVSLSSSGIIEPQVGLIVSNSIRAALAGWIKTISMQVATHNITLNTVVLGRVQTNRLDTIEQNKAQQSNLPLEEFRANSISQIPCGRYGTAEEVAHLVCFLFSDLAAYINGTSIRVDGGLIKQI